MKREVVVNIINYTALRQVVASLENWTAAELSASHHVGLLWVGVGFILAELPILKMHSLFGHWNPAWTAFLSSTG